MNTKKTCVLLFLLLALTGNKLLAQNEANVWWFGYRAGIDFNTNPPTVLNTTIPINTYEGSSTICDPVTGALIFATDGQTVWYPNGTIVPGGTGLRGSFSSAQSALIVPNPANPDQWYIFTANVNPPNGTPYGTNYYTVTRTGATLAVSTFTNLLGSTLSTEHLCGLGDGAGGYWIVTHGTSGGGSNTFYSFHVPASGIINTTPVTSNAGHAVTDYQGSMKANTCQTQLAATYLGGGRTEVYNFNNTTGQVTGLVWSVAGLTQPYGLEFSPNDAYLYHGTLTGICYQLNIGTGVNTNTGWVAPPNGVGNFGQFQLAPDGKIYVASENINTVSYLGIISAPNNVYTAANYSNTGLQIATVNSYYPLLGLPTFSRTFVSGILHAFPSSGTYCVNTDIPLSYTFTGAVSSQTWTVTPVAGWSYTSGNGSSPNPTIRFTNTGTYDIQLEVISCGRTYTETLTFTITSPLVPSGTINCADPHLILDNPAADPNEPSYVWYKNSVSPTNIIGTGTPVNYAAGGNSAAPTQICVAVASSASTSLGSNSIAAALTLPSAANGTPYTSNPIHVLSDALILKSFDVRFWVCPGAPFNVTIRDNTNAIVYSENKSPAGCVGGGGATLFTVPINTTLSRGNNYSITITGGQLYRNSWSTVTNPGEITYGPEPAAGITSIANIQYDYLNYNVVTTCSTPQCYPIGCSLPVVLIDFNGTQSGSNVKLVWRTSSEVNNRHFEIERSYDGTSFESIGKVHGSSNSNEVKKYTWYDTEAHAGLNYYRLVQYDHNGDYSYSAVVLVDMSEESGELFTVFPNPSQDFFTVMIKDKFENASIRLLDALGKEIHHQKITGQDNGIQLGSDLTKGIYIIHVITPSRSETKLLVKE